MSGLLPVAARVLAGSLLLYFASPSFAQTGELKAADVGCTAPGGDPKTDIDLRVFEPLSNDPETAYAWKNAVLQAAPGSKLAPLGTDGCLGFGVDSGKPANLEIERGEKINLSFTPAPGGTYAFDITGVYLSLLDDRSGPGSTCLVTLTTIDNDVTAYSISRDSTPLPDSDGNVFLFNFPLVEPDPEPGEEALPLPIRITGAEVTAVKGDCGVIGFANNPLEFGGDNGISCAVNNEDPRCHNRLAQEIELDASFNEAVVGMLFKEGVTVVRDDRPDCRNYHPTNPGPSLPIDVDNDSRPDLFIPPEYCGVGTPPVIKVLALRSTLQIDADVIDLLFDDNGTCETPGAPEDRLLALRWPNNLLSGVVDSNPPQPDNPPFDEIPYLRPADAPESGVTFDDTRVPRGIAVPGCGSFRGNAFSLLAYNMTHASAAVYPVLVKRRLDDLELYVSTLEPCIDRYGVANSTLKTYVNLIHDNYENQRYGKMVDFIIDFTEELRDQSSNLYTELQSCSFDRGFTDYPFVASGESGSPFSNQNSVPEPNDPVPANAIGTLRAQLENLRWLAEGLEEP